MSPAKQLDPDTLAKLRLSVGVPPEGPTEALKNRWATEDRLLAHDDVGNVDEPAVTDVDKLNALLAELRGQLRSEHGRRGNLASQLTKARQENERLRAERDQLAIDAAETPQLRAQLAEARAGVERAEHQQNTWKGDHDRLVAELEQARRETGTWESEYERVVDDKLVELTEALEERDRLAGLLEEAGHRIAFMQRQVEDVVARCDDLVAEASAPPRHLHAWEVMPGLKPMPLPCSCGLPWPRQRPLDTVASEPSRARVEFLKPPNTSAEPTGDNT